MADDPKLLSKKLLSEGKRLLDFFIDLDESQWRLRVYSEGSEWQIKDVLAHFVSAEKSFLKLLINITEGGQGASEDFSLDRFNLSQVAKLNSVPINELIEEFSSSRKALSAWVAERSYDDLEIRGRHPVLGITSLKEIIKMVYLHNQMHLRDMKRIIRSD